LWTNGPEFSSGWNFGPNDDVREVSWIVERMVKLWGENAQWALDRDKNPHEAEYLKLDCSKAKNILKWSPKLSLSVTLEWIIEWYRNYQQDKDMRYYTESEISRYEKLKNIGADNFSYAI
jgi:CDP-glucose 4,6-dehydratase